MTLRNSIRKVREKGVLMLMNNEKKYSKHDILLLIPPYIDKTIEIARVRICIQSNNK